MVFLGLGNHGGGPTEKLIRWVEEHRGIVPDARLEFSTVNRFFDAIAESRIPLPVVTGELQMHAVGCYTVVRRIKTGVRNAENALARAGHVALPEEQPALERAWEAVLSHHFHDTLGGTAPPDAFEFAFNQLGGAAALAEEALVYAVRRQMLSLPDDPLPRLVLANPGADQFNGWCEASVYFEHEWRRTWRLLASGGGWQPIHNSEIRPSGLVGGALPLRPNHSGDLFGRTLYFTSSASGVLQRSSLLYEIHRPDVRFPQSSLSPALRL